MSDRAPLKATFAVFEKREGGILAAAAVGFCLLSLLLSVAFLLANLGAIVEVCSWYAGVMKTVAAGGTPDVHEFPPGYFHIMGGSVLFMIPFYVLFAAFEAGCYRWMIRGEKEGLFGLSLGADTWRVWAGYWVWLGLGIAAWALIVLVCLLFAAIVAGVTAAAGKAGGVVMAMLIPIAGLAFVLGLIYAAVRMAPANATSVGLRRFAFFSAWKVSKDRFWALFGSYFLLTLGYLIVGLVVSSLSFGPLLAGIATSAKAGQDPSTAITNLISSSGFWVGAGLTMVIGYLASLVLRMIYILSCFGIAAKAVRVAIDEGKISA